MDRPGGRRQQQRATQRARILTAALALFDERGWEGTRVQDIADAAGVSLPTLFRYFPTKPDLLFDDDARILAAWTAALAAAPAGLRLVDALRYATTRGSLPAIDPRLARIRALLQPGERELELRDLAFRADAERAVARAVATRMGLDPADPRARAVVAAAMGAVRAAQEAAGREHGDLAARVDGALASLDELGALLATPLPAANPPEAPTSRAGTPGRDPRS